MAREWFALYCDIEGHLCLELLQHRTLTNHYRLVVSWVARYPILSPHERVLDDYFLDTLSHLHEHVVSIRQRYHDLCVIAHA